MFKVKDGLRVGATNVIDSSGNLLTLAANASLLNGHADTEFLRLTGDSTITGSLTVNGDLHIANTNSAYLGASVVFQNSIDNYTNVQFNDVNGNPIAAMFGGTTADHAFYFDADQILFADFTDANTFIDATAAKVDIKSGNATKLSVTSTGATVTGTLTADNVASTGSFQFGPQTGATNVTSYLDSSGATSTAGPSLQLRSWTGGVATARGTLTGTTSGLLLNSSLYIIFNTAGSEVGYVGTSTGWVFEANARFSSSCKLTTAAPTSLAAGLNLPHGSAPSSPTNGDVWTTTSGVFWRINGSTVQVTTGGGTATGTNTGDQTITLTGDVTGTGTGSFATAIGANKVTRGMLAATAGAVLLGATAAGNVADLTGTQATTLLDTFTTSLKGLVPASGGGQTNFLRADGTWAAPPGGGGTTTNALTLSNAGTGAASGTTFNGASAVTISYNSIGAQPVSTQLTNLASAAWSAGTQVLTLTAANTVTLKTVGASTGNILDKASGDTLYLGFGGGTLTGKLNTVASATGGAGLNLPAGAAPTAPTNGDLWTTTSGLFARVNGSTVQFATGTGTATGTNTGDQTITLTGDVTGSGTGSFATAIGANKVTRGMLAATSGATILGATAAGNVTDLTNTQAKTFLAIASGDVSGLAPSATTDTTNATNISSGTLNSARLPVQGFTIGCSGTPANSQRIGPVIAPYAFTITGASCAGKALVAATASTVFTLKKGTVASPTTIGTFTFAASGTTATVSITAGAVSAGDVLWLDSPSTADATCADITFLVRA